jgi:hypothetical protein
MKKFIITEEEKINILKQYNIQEQSSNDFGDVVEPILTAMRGGQATYRTAIIRTPEDLSKFINWIPSTSGLQSIIEPLFGVTCKTSAEIEKSTTAGEYGYAGKCLQIWRFVTLMLNFYLKTGKTPDTLDFSTAINSAGLDDMYKDLVRGNDEKGNKFNEFVAGGVYVQPMRLKSGFKKIYNDQLELF